MTESHLCAARALRELAGGLAPRIAVVLGSGWSGLTVLMHDTVRIPYARLEGFPGTNVAGHAGELWLGRIGACDVAVMNGRTHPYETGDVAAMRVPILTLREAGCDTLVLTNAAGSLADTMRPGSLMLLTDHINPSQRSPLVGEAGLERFVDMRDAYDPLLRGIAHTAAAREGIALHEGVYAWHFGPQFETPAEIRMLRQFGAHAVGMSTVPETILARRAGMRVLALSLITNMAAGLSGEVLSHTHTLAQASLAGERASRLLARIVEDLGR